VEEKDQTGSEIHSGPCPNTNRMGWDRRLGELERRRHRDGANGSDLALLVVRGDDLAFLGYKGISRDDVEGCCHRDDLVGGGVRDLRDRGYWGGISCSGTDCKCGGAVYPDDRDWGATRNVDVLSAYSDLEHEGTLVGRRLSHTRIMGGAQMVVGRGRARRKPLEKRREKPGGQKGGGVQLDGCGR